MLLLVQEREIEIAQRHMLKLDIECVGAGGEGLQEPVCNRRAYRSGPGAAREDHDSRGLR
ncbi:hypothetical protein GCM10010922_07340 [Microbacterium sorbitolivorans]|nr:hypothetical protein GCM10010922_07340 [Microbacterium sorbitolivorans]